MKDKILRSNLYLGLGILIAAVALRDSGGAFLKNWFYIFTWWPLILIFDSINYRKNKESPLSQSGKDFLFAAYVSVFIWLIFELFNVRLQNWSYFDLPRERLLRWLGYFLAFSSVLPALKELSVMFASWHKGRGPVLFRIRNSTALSSFMMGSGGAVLLLALIWPRVFFPLVWVGFILLIDPLNLRLGNQSLLQDLEQKDWGRVWSWIMAGAAAGGLWELLNYWSGSHWEYSLPYLDFARVFQMPLCGYAGFLPFALEVFALDQLFGCGRQRLSQDKRLFWVVLVLFLAVYAGIFYLIDIYTVRSWQ